MPFPVRRLLLTTLCLLLLTGCRSEEPRHQAPAETGTKTVEAVLSPDPPAPPAPPSVEDGPPPPPPAPAPQQTEPPPTSVRPRVAIIIDDMGYDRDIGRQLIDLDLHLSFSFLPDAPHARELADQTARRGRDVLIHLPMEPKEVTARLEPDTLLVADGPDLLQEKIARLTAAIPHAIGANNHMGSRFSEHLPGMEAVMEALGNRSLFFVDSFTSGDSLGLATARRRGLAATRRDLFLDNQQDADRICRQMEALARMAHRRGQAVGSGHPYQATLEAIRRCGGQLSREVEVVGVRHLIEKDHQVPP